MAEYLVDTDILIDHLRGQHELRPRKRDRVAFSVISRAELFAGHASAEDDVSRLLDSLEELPVGRHIAEAAGRIRRATGVRLPDALIAATAIEHKLSLRTRNRRDYARVPELRIVGS